MKTACFSLPRILGGNFFSQEQKAVSVAITPVSHKVPSCCCWDYQEAGAGKQHPLKPWEIGSWMQVTWGHLPTSGHFSLLQLSLWNQYLTWLMDSSHPPGNLYTMLHFSAFCSSLVTLCGSFYGKWGLVWEWRTSQVALVVKNPPAKAGRCKRCGFDPWVEKSPWRRACNALQYSCLENPMDRGACQVIVHGVQSRTRLKRLSTHSQKWKSSGGLCWWSSGYKSTHQCREQGLDPWSKKIPHAAEQRSLCATNYWACTLDPQRERSFHSLQIKKARVPQRRPRAARYIYNIYIYIYTHTHTNIKKRSSG